MVAAKSESARELVALPEGAWRAILDLDIDEPLFAIPIPIAIGFEFE